MQKQPKQILIDPTWAQIVQTIGTSKDILKHKNFDLLIKTLKMLGWHMTFIRGEIVHRKVSRGQNRDRYDKRPDGIQLWASDPHNLKPNTNIDLILTYSVIATANFDNLTFDMQRIENLAGRILNDLNGKQVTYHRPMTEFHPLGKIENIRKFMLTLPKFDKKLELLDFELTLNNYPHPSIDELC